MPANPRSLRITDTYRQRLIALRDRIRQQVVAMWGIVTLEDLERSHRDWLTRAAATVDQGQRAGIRLTAAYLAAYVASELGRLPDVAPVEEARYLGSEDGRSIDESLATTLITVKTLLSESRRRDSLQAGQTRAGRLASTALMTAPRTALSDALATDDRFAGWRRVAKPGACLACLAAAGDVLGPGERLQFHDECSCTAEPVLAGLPDQAHRATGRDLFDAMTPAQQDERYGEKAALVRDGQAQLTDFIDRSPMAIVPDRLTEAPLQAVTQ